MANMTRWTPFDEALSLRDAMNRLFEDSFVPASWSRANTLGVETNVYEQADSFIVEASVPGLKPEDLDITLHDNVLTITGEFRQVEQPDGTTTHRTERRYGRFSRSFSLPTAVKGDSVHAQLEHGILTLNIPKAEEAKPRKINVQVGRGQQTLEAGK